MLELTYNQNIEKASIFCLHEIYVGYISISHMCIFNATLKLRETTSYIIKNTCDVALHLRLYILKNIFIAGVFNQFCETFWKSFFVEHLRYCFWKKLIYKIMQV